MKKSPFRITVLILCVLVTSDRLAAQDNALSVEILEPPLEVGLSNSSGLADVLPGYLPPSPFAESVEPQSRSTAVALNYCRASLHRIRSEPTETVLAEERRRILDNISLAQIEDPEVIRLYSALLEEISTIPLREVERDLVRSNHNRSIRRQVAWDVLAFSTSVATAQFGSALKMGADSWWDTRDQLNRREIDALKLDRSEIQDVVAKSNLFLDTFWKLARKRNIPDAWLVRGADLDRLATANLEDDPEIRLRRLMRLEQYLLAYPPFWYHVARTQQESGHFSDAAATYERLEQLASGHLRNDEMLAASLANLALIQDEMGDTRSVHTAARALAAAPEVPLANLAAARVLQRNGQVYLAEEAVLRNIDAGLDLATSQTFRLGLYYHSGQDEKLLAALSDPEVARTASAAAVLRCLTKFEPREYPAAVVAELSRSLAAYPRLTFGADELIIAADYRWRLPQVGFQFPVNSDEQPTPQIASIRGGYSARFAGGFEWGNPFQQPDEVEVEVVMTYPDATAVTLTLASSKEHRPVASRGVASPAPLIVKAARVDGVQVSFNTLPTQAATLIGNEYAVQ